jgi:fluoride exporter
MGLTILAISTGAALGALARWGLGLTLNHLFPALPPGTVVANLVGGYLVGLALPLLAAHPEWDPAWRLFLVTGFLGGLTTFSTFSGEIATLLNQGRWALALGGAGLHLLGSLALTAAGFATVQVLRSGT